MHEFEEFKGTFFAECAELLVDVESQLSALRDGSEDPEVLHAIFRAVHSIKAGAGALKFDLLAKFSHGFEAMLDKMRDGKIVVTLDVIDILYRASDVLSDMVDAAESKTDLAQDYGSEVIVEINDLAGVSASAITVKPSSGESSNSVDEVTPKTAIKYNISFSPKLELFLHANEPLLLVRELKSLGEVIIEADLSRLPAFMDMDAEGAYIDWKFEVVTDAGEEAVREVFEFVEDDCELSITFEAMEENSSVSEDAAQADVTEQVQQSNSGQPEKEPTKTAKISSIRVDLDRLDRLVNMVGELVITQSMLTQQTDEIPIEKMPNMARGLEELAFHTRELQESVMAIRMQPVKSVFARMPRLVRDLASKLNKNVNLVTIGENTEVDKTVVEEISDPINHMIRNSVDHGLESTEDRIAAGKPEEGTITLSAEHRAGRIIISISDDGAGINRERVHSLALKNGLISENSKLSNEEIDNLIFAPGFSTADKVTDVSGRGVGMDVVRRNIQALGGRITIQSNPGKGSRFIMTLPLTLAVMDGMIVVSGNGKYVIPIPNILESLRPEKEALKRLPNGQEMVRIRGEYIPLAFLHRAFQLTGAETDPAKALVVLAESEEHGKIGIVVDQLIGQQQVVIKSLESNYQPVTGISAATILGNGMVAPILDVEALYMLSITESHLDSLSFEQSAPDIQPQLAAAKTSTTTSPPHETSTGSSQ
ncbi:MAG: chemotaxis protein CheA [Sneathiella sp.]